MGRRKIQIAPLADERNRSVTFAKRKAGLFKKAFELSVLCSAEIAVVVHAQNGKLYEFSSTGNINAVLLRRANHSEPTESKGPHDFPGLSASSGIHKDDEDDDDDGSVDQAPAHRRPSTTSPGSLHSEKSALEAEPVLDHSTSQQPPPYSIESEASASNYPQFSANNTEPNYSIPSLPMLTSYDTSSSSSSASPYAHLQATLAIQQHNALLINNLAASQSILAQHQASRQSHQSASNVLLNMQPYAMHAFRPTFPQSYGTLNEKTSRSGSATMVELSGLSENAKVEHPMLRSVSDDLSSRAPFDLRATCSDATVALNAMAQEAMPDLSSSYYPIMTSTAFYSSPSQTEYSQDHFTQDFNNTFPDSYFGPIHTESPLKAAYPDVGKRFMDDVSPTSTKRRRLSDFAQS